MSGFSARDLHPSSGNLDIDEAMEHYASLASTVIDLTDAGGARTVDPSHTDTQEPTETHVVNVRLILSDGREVL